LRKLRTKATLVVSEIVAVVCDKGLSISESKLHCKFYTSRDRLGGWLVELAEDNHTWLCFLWMNANWSLTTIYYFI